jgi:hypothetical protein
LFLIQQKQRVAMVETLAKDFTHLAAQLKSSEEPISLSLQNVSAVIMSMQIITMNARIETARAGERGKAFEVVVEAMQGTMGNIERRWRTSPGPLKNPSRLRWICCRRNGNSRRPCPREDRDLVVNIRKFFSTYYLGHIIHN